MTWQRNSASASSAAATSRPPISGLRRCSRASRCAPAPTSTWRPPRRAPRSSACAPRPSTGCSQANDIDIVVNLTIPAVHYDVSRQVLDAGKHVYSEKPFVLSVKEGLDLKKRAEKKGLRIGSAPDTFLGGAHQLARAPDRYRQARQDHQRHLPRDEPRHGALASQSRTSSSSRAPGRCSISAPITSSNLIQLIGPVKRVGALSPHAGQGAHHHRRSRASARRSR